MSGAGAPTTSTPIDGSGLPVVAIAGLAELLQFTGENSELVQHRAALLDYRNRHGVAA